MLAKDRCSSLKRFVPAKRWYRIRTFHFPPITSIVLCILYVILLDLIVEEVDKTKTENKSVKIYKSGGFHWVGDGFPVRSVFSYNDLGKELSPFLLLDYAPPYMFSPTYGKRGVGGHPHRGFETVTIAYQGEIEHRDSHGGGGIIGPGDVQWMTAAGGLVHEEFHSKKFAETGGLFEMVQLWVNLPAKDKGTMPAYQPIVDTSIPRVALEDDAGVLRIIAGELGSTRGPAKTFTPINLWDMQLHSGKSTAIPLPKGHTKVILILDGAAEVLTENADNGDLVICDKELSSIEIKARKDSKVLVLSGQPINEPIVGYGPFVMNSEAEIRRAFIDYENGTFGTLSPPTE